MERIYPLNIFGWRQTQAAARAEGISTRRPLSSSTAKKLTKQLGASMAFVGQYKVNEKHVTLNWRLVGTKSPQDYQTKLNMDNLALGLGEIARQIFTSLKIKEVGYITIPIPKLSAMQWQDYGQALKLLAREAFHDTSHYLRAEHLEQLAKILKDDEASNNDKFVAMELLKNANIAAGGVLPMCQDTGTPIVFAKKGQQVWTSGNDEAALSEGISRAYAENNLRYSQMAPLDMYREVNTGDNLPAQIDILATGGDAYKLMFIAKGGGSANKAFLYQETKALLNPDRLYDFLEEKLLSIGTAACPPYHLALVIGGTSAEACMKTMKLASCHYLDNMPTAGNKYGQAFRDLDTEAKLLEIAQYIGVGAQFGGKYFAHDVRVIRLPRHGAPNLAE